MTHLAGNHDWLILYSIGYNIYGIVERVYVLSTPQTSETTEQVWHVTDVTAESGVWSHAIAYPTLFTTSEFYHGK